MSGVLDDSYLEKGLTAMARTTGHWFGAHWGASVIAGYYLCKENRLSDETVTAVKAQLDLMLMSRESRFEPRPAQPADEGLIQEVPKAVVPVMQGGLRHHGHAVIFASLSTKALRDVPELAQPAIIDGLTALSRSIAPQVPKAPASDEPYGDTQSMVEATFDSVARFETLVGHPSIKRPNFTHMMTHTDALMTLEMMGFADVAVSGHAGHRAHIDVPVPDVAPDGPGPAKRTTLEEIMEPSFWENEDNVARWNAKANTISNRNGDWVAAGHLFKMLYSYHRLAKRVEDRDKVRLCSGILLERYVNPEVQGG